MNNNKNRRLNIYRRLMSLHRKNLLSPYLLTTLRTVQHTCCKRSAFHQSLNTYRHNCVGRGGVHTTVFSFLLEACCCGRLLFSQSPRGKPPHHPHTILLAFLLHYPNWCDPQNSGKDLHSCDLPSQPNRRQSP